MELETGLRRALFRQCGARAILVLNGSYQFIIIKDDRKAKLEPLGGQR